MRKLNDKQREMIQENHALIYYVAGQLGVDVDEWYDTFALGICEAAYSFKEGKNQKFSTFAVTVMKQEFYKEMAFRTRKKRSAERKVLSLEMPINSIFEIAEITLGEAIEGGCDVAGTVEDLLIAESVENFLNVLDARDKRWVGMRLEGMTLREIAAIEGVSYQRINFKLHKIAERLQKEIA